MRRSIRAQQGATLLEIMLVLSIIALIILMSVRYYQATTNASQTQQALELIQAITASADNLALGSSGGYSNATASNITSLAGSSVLISPWGGTVSIAGQTATAYQITIPHAPTAVCTNVTNKLKTNTKYTNLNCDDNLSYVYDSTS